jgi:hypothetical protein
VAVEDAGLDPGVDLIEALRQLSQIATACSVGGPMCSSRQPIELTDALMFVKEIFQERDGEDLQLGAAVRTR